MTYLSINRFTTSILALTGLALTISTQSHSFVYHAPPSVAPRIDVVSQRVEQYRAKRTEDLYWLARTGMGEASGLTEKEEEEVMAVVMSRAESPKFSSTIKGVVTQNRQFSMYNMGNPNKQRTHDEFAAKLHSDTLLRSMDIAIKVYGQKPEDRILPTDVLHYHSKEVSPQWAKEMPVYKSSGAHIFYDGGFNAKRPNS